MTSAQSAGNAPDSFGRVGFRDATERDIEAIAALHVDSWRRNYRGAYSDAYLDSDVLADRLAVWTGRLAGSPPSTKHRTIVAERDGVLIGFAHVVFDAHPRLGALLDNIHVAQDLKGRGIGTQLMAEVAQTVIDRRPGSGVFLGVLEQNAAAQAFYDARRGKRVSRQLVDTPDGGKVASFIYGWRNPATLTAQG